jgi:hypothetical protein
VGDGSVAMLVDPIALLGSATDEGLRALAAEVHARLSRVAERLGQGA